MGGVPRRILGRRRWRLREPWRRRSGASRRWWTPLMEPSAKGQVVRDRARDGIASTGSLPVRSRPWDGKRPVQVFLRLGKWPGAQASSVARALLLWGNGENPSCWPLGLRWLSWLWSRSVNPWTQRTSLAFLPVKKKGTPSPARLAANEGMTG